MARTTVGFHRRIPTLEEQEELQRRAIVRQLMAVSPAADRRLTLYEKLYLSARTAITMAATGAARHMISPVAAGIMEANKSGVLLHVRGGDHETSGPPVSAATPRLPFSKPGSERERCERNLTKLLAVRQRLQAMAGNENRQLRLVHAVSGGDEQTRVVRGTVRQRGWGGHSGGRN